MCLCVCVCVCIQASAYPNLCLCMCVCVCVCVCVNSAHSSSEEGLQVIDGQNPPDGHSSHTQKQTHIPTHRDRKSWRQERTGI